MLHRKIDYIWVVTVVIVTLLCGCRTAGTAGGGGFPNVKGNESKVISALLAKPETDMLQAKVSYQVAGAKISGQLRMAWGAAVQMNVSLLGLKELLRIEFTPEYVQVYLPTAKCYSRMAYSQIPYISAAKLDFNVVQGIFWNRMFVPGVSDAGDAKKKIVLKSRSESSVTYTDLVAGYSFMVDRGYLVQVSNAGKGFAVSVDYDRTGSYDQSVLPNGYVWSATDGRKMLNATISVSDVSTGHVSLWNTSLKNAKEVTSEELLDLISDLL